MQFSLPKKTRTINLVRGRPAELCEAIMDGFSAGRSRNSANGAFQICSPQDCQELGISSVLQSIHLRSATPTYYPVHSQDASEYYTSSTRSKDIHIELAAYFGIKRSPWFTIDIEIADDRERLMGESVSQHESKYSQCCPSCSKLRGSLLECQ